MKKSLLHKYRVDNVPLPLIPLFYLASCVLALLLLLFYVILHFTCKITVCGGENLEQNKNYIYCFWHSYVPVYFTVFFSSKAKVWMQHPIWYMKPVHLALMFSGAKKIILGSTGHSGREAAEEILKYIKMGHSTVIIPDGPYGPPRALKKGVLHTAKNSGVPLVPINFRVSKFKLLNGWDRKVLPMPFSKIELIYGKPVYIDEKNIKDMEQELCVLMERTDSKSCIKI